VLLLFGCLDAVSLCRRIVLHGEDISVLLEQFILVHGAKSAGEAQLSTVAAALWTHLAITLTPEDIVSDDPMLPEGVLVKP